MTNKLNKRTRCERYMKTEPYQNIDAQAKSIIDIIMSLLEDADLCELDDKSCIELLSEFAPNHKLLVADKLTWGRMIHTIITELLEEPVVVTNRNKEELH